MNDRKPPSLFRLVGGLLMGLTAIFVSSLMLTAISDREFWLVFFAVLGNTLFTGTILLVWLTRWAMRDEGRTNQFGIGTLLMLTGLAAVFLGFVRWLIGQSGPLQSMGHASQFITVCITGVILMAFSLIPLLSMAESLVWLAARMVRWGPARKCCNTNPKRKRGINTNPKRKRGDQG